MTSNLHPLFASILAPYQQRSIDIAEQAVRMNTELMEIYNRLSPNDKVKYAPLIQEHINKTARIIGRIKESEK